MSGALIETTRGRCEPQLDNTRGWQRAASQAVDGFCQQTLLRELDASSAALLDSQTGPYDLNVVPVRQDERRIEVIANGCLCGAVCSLPLTPHWCRPSLQLACHAETVATPLGQRCVSLNVPKLGHTQSLLPGAAVGSSC